MNIAVIGSGNVGSTLAEQFAKAGYPVCYGVRDLDNFKGKGKDTAIVAKSIPDAVTFADVLVIAGPAQLAADIAKSLGNVEGKVIIDVMNGVFLKPEGFSNTADAILANCNTTDVVKCFNTTGFENMADPDFNGTQLDMFVAGNSAKGKAIAQELAKAIGFENCYDFGGNKQFDLIEQMAACWINLAIMQKHGRGIAFKVIRR